jgi:hypothetical protein
MRVAPHKFDNLSWAVYPLAGFLVVIGAKCWLIARYGNPTPFWDQWDAEAANLYGPFLHGSLRFSDLIAAHNEHRVLVTRLWSLLLLELEGYWDPILQMVANTLLFGAVLVLLITIFRPILDRTAWIAFSLIATIIFALPFGWENTLAGFNSQWYFLLFFSIAGLRVITDAAAFTPRWWLAALLLILSYFSMAAGAISVAAAVAIGVVQVIVGRRSGLREVLALALLVTLALAMAHFTPVSKGQAAYNAHAVMPFVRSLFFITSWPLTFTRSGVLHLAATVITQAPVLLAAILVIVERPVLSDRRWLLIVLAGWSALQMLATAYARALAPLAPRYLDLYDVVFLLNCACLFYLRGAPVPRWFGRRFTNSAVVLWLLLTMLGVTVYTLRHSISGVQIQKVEAEAQAQNLRAYLATGDIGALENKPIRYIPYSDPQRLAAIVSAPAIRAILPPALVGEASAARAQQHGLARYTGKATEAVKNIALHWGALLIPLGLALFVVGLAHDRRRSRTKIAPAVP